jgi:hypothetical protein
MVVVWIPSIPRWSATPGRHCRDLTFISASNFTGTGNAEQRHHRRYRADTMSAGAGNDTMIEWCRR